MNVQVALVHVNSEYWLDRQIAKLRGGQAYSHAAFLVDVEPTDPTWYDVHWRWFRSDFRVILAKNYAWPYDTYAIDGLDTLRAIKLYQWLKQQKEDWVNYDLIGAIRMALNATSVNSPRSFTCFELISRGLWHAGYPLAFNPEKALASDLLKSGYLKKV